MIYRDQPHDHHPIGPRMVVRVRAFPRLHVGLLDLGGTTGRTYGGMGFALSGPASEIRAEASAQARVQSTRIGTPADVRSWDGLVKRLEASGLSAKINVALAPPAHVGLGTKTTTLMGMAYAAMLAHDILPAHRELVGLSGRGGTSGIGVNTFLQGGFVVDAGHPSSGAFASAQPSSALHNLKAPPVMLRQSPPSTWVVDLAVAQGVTVSGADESAFFRQNTPIPKSEVLDAIALCYHGIAPSVVDGDLAALADSVASFSKIGFKRREIIAQPAALELIEAMRRFAPAIPCGMSSLGPLVYIIRDRDDLGNRDRFRGLAFQGGASYMGTVGLRSAEQGVITNE